MRKYGAKEDERVEVLNGADPHDAGAVPEVRLDPEVVARERGSAVDPNAPEPDGIPKPKWFRIVQGGIVLENGFRTRLKEGKEINSLNYNIRRLQQQGIKLVEFDPDELGDATSLT